MTPVPVQAHWSCSANCISSNVSGNRYFDEGIVTDGSDSPAKCLADLDEQCRDKLRGLAAYKGLGVNIQPIGRDGEIRFQVASIFNACMRDQ